ncbi:MAG: HXXEE domain-containing protein [Deinococcota bacterium]
MNNRLSLGFLVLLFAALWLPLGQHAFLVPHWMQVGTFMAPALLFMLFSERQTNTEGINFRTMSVIMLVLYIVHQFEEHWLDIFGNYYAFYPSVNALLAGVLGQDVTSFEVLTPLSIFVINTSLVWLVGFIAIGFGETTRFPALAMNGIILVNAVTHIMASVAQQAYNPGTLTSIVLFIPFALYFYRQVTVNNLVSGFEVVASLVWAILAHVLMVGGLIGANWLQIYPESYYHVALVVWSLVPIFVFRVQSPVKT